MPLNDFRSVHLPYCLCREEDGSYVVLNREYKPLGFRTREHIDYGKYPIAVKFKRFTPKAAAKLSWNNSGAMDRIYLYDDSCTPTKSPKFMKMYLEKLERLAKCQFTKAKDV